MEQYKIFEDFYKFSTEVKTMPFSFNQYLFLCEEPILIHTGSIQQMRELLPKLSVLLNGKELKYVFVSHFESDECGGLAFLHEHFPKIKVICSEVTARQLTGFGFNYDVITKRPNEALEIKALIFKFISYPSEMHLWEGILTMEANRGILFSSDLFLKTESIAEKEIISSWENEINSLNDKSIPSEQRLNDLKENLMNLDIKYIATGHGPFIKIQ